jgi:DNA repair protein RecO (recombination protein O)
MSWYSVKTEGVVLKSLPFREVDRRYTIFTKDYGKIEVMGKGAQKELAKLAPTLEPFGVLNLEIVRGQVWTTVISADKIERFAKIQSSYDLRVFAQTLFHIVDMYIREADRDIQMYNLLIDWLRGIEAVDCEHPTRATFFMGGFLMRFLEQMGYQVALNNCVSCYAKIMPFSFRWHGGKGGLVCSDCVKQKESDHFAARNIDEKVLVLLRFAAEADIDEFANLRLSGALVSDFAGIVNDLVKFHIPDANERPFWEGLVLDK